MKGDRYFEALFCLLAPVSWRPYYEMKVKS